MVITILEGRVARLHWPTLQQAFDLARVQMPEGLVESYLAHDLADLEAWRIISVWHSRQAFEHARRAEAVPGDLAIFRSAGSEPKLSVFDVAGRLLGESPDFDTD